MNCIHRSCLRAPSAAILRLLLEVIRPMLLRIALVSVLLASPALAGQSEWQEVLPDVRMRLVAMPYFGQPHEIAAAI